MLDEEGTGLSEYEMARVQVQVTMGWSGCGIEWVQVEVRLGWNGYEIEWV